MSDVKPADSSTGQRHPYTVCVEGNIGSGKSTFLSHCANKHDIEVLPEPIADWTNVGGVNLLANLYTDPVKWGMTFQTYVTLTMLQSHLRSSGAPIKVMERSIFSARNCFVKNMLADGSLQPGMFNVLQEWYDFIDTYHQVQVDLIIYLRTTPDVAFQRLKSRGRQEEEAVPINLLSSLHYLHEEWIAMERDIRGTPIVIIDADQSLAELQPLYDINIKNMYSNIQSMARNV